MSMLSAQCDELRSMAESVGLAMPQAATLMMEAADTIWELRCKCAGMVDMRERARLAETENARLREQVAEACMQLGGAWVRCTKLRELVRDYERCTMHADCSRCEYDGKLSTHCPLSPCFPDADELRELGVEVTA